MRREVLDGIGGGDNGRGGDGDSEGEDEGDDGGHGSRGSRGRGGGGCIVTATTEWIQKRRAAAAKTNALAEGGRTGGRGGES
jgi:hypothetical protein